MLLNKIKVFNLIIISFIVALSGCWDSNNNIIVLDKNPVDVDQNFSHIAFPDAVTWCKKNIVVYRAGFSHASDKGFVVVGVFDQNRIDTKFAVEDSEYDIRNPYLVADGDELLLYVSVYNYRNHEDGFLGTRLYKISSGCEILNKAKLIKNINWDVVYAPIKLQVGSFSKKINRKNWCISTMDGGNCDLIVDDEEMALVYDRSTGNYFGVLRNHPKVGLPLKLLTFDNEGVLKSNTSWCRNDNSNSALVSPKIYNIENKYLVLYAEREIISSAEKDGKQRGAIWIKMFDTINDLRNCNPTLVYKSPDATNIDMGYPSIIYENGMPAVIWYETNGVSTGLVTSSIKKVSTP